jgi:hypothetical protein
MSRRLLQLAPKGAASLCNVQQISSGRSFRTSAFALAKGSCFLEAVVTCWTFHANYSLFTQISVMAFTTAAKKQPAATKSFKQKTKSTSEVRMKHHVFELIHSFVSPFILHCIVCRCHRCCWKEQWNVLQVKTYYQLERVFARTHHRRCCQ